MQKDKEGISSYIATVAEIQSLEEIEAGIRQNSYEIGENGYITTDGFELVSLDQGTRIIECNYWKYISKTEIGPKYEIKVIEHNVKIPFVIKCDARQIVFYSRQRPYVMSARKFIAEKLNLTFTNSIPDLSPTETREKFVQLMQSIERRIGGER